MDLETGAVHIPAQSRLAHDQTCSHTRYSRLSMPSSQVLPKGKPWRDVVRYDNPFGNEGGEG